MNCEIEDDFTMFFDDVLRKLFDLMLDKRIPLDIEIVFEDIDYWYVCKCDSINDAQMLSEYKQPKCNKMVCIPLEKPQVSFGVDAKYNYSHVLRISNCTKAD